MNLTVNELKLTGLWAGNHYLTVWILKLAFGPEKFPRLSLNHLCL